jgi:hypothetical protein
MNIDTKRLLVTLVTNKIWGKYMTCKQNSDKKGYTCAVDVPGALKGPELDRVNRAYTRAVNRLLSNSGKAKIVQAVDPKGRKITRQITAGAIAKGLIDARVKYKTTAEKSLIKSAGGGGVRAKTELTGEITFYLDGIKQDDAGLTRTFIHEGAHTTDGARALSVASGSDDSWVRWWYETPTFNQSHQVSFKKLAKDFYDEFDFKK